MVKSIRIKLILGLILTVFYACNSSTQQESNTIKKEKDPNFFHEPIIDTTILLSNEKLPTLIKELEKSNLKEKKRVKEIPNTIWKTLNKMTSDNFSIADFGEKWQVTDVVIEELPKRQLVYLGLGDNIILLAYYSGGIGESEHILIFKHKNQQVIGLRYANTLHDLKTKNEILKFLKKNVKNKSEFNTNSPYF